MVLGSRVCLAIDTLRSVWNLKSFQKPHYLSHLSITCLGQDYALLDKLNGCHGTGLDPGISQSDLRAIDGLKDKPFDGIGVILNARQAWEDPTPHGICVSAFDHLGDLKVAAADQFDLLVASRQDAWHSSVKTVRDIGCPVGVKLHRLFLNGYGLSGNGVMARTLRINRFGAYRNTEHAMSEYPISKASNIYGSSFLLRLLYILAANAL